MKKKLTGIKITKRIKERKNRNFFPSLSILFIPVKISVFVCVYLWIIFLVSCQSKPTDLRTLAPADSIVYFETNDLGKTLESLTESRAFAELAGEKTDFSALENVQFAVAVAGFETSEQETGGDGAVLSFKPRFVAIADTHAWNFSAASLAENQIGRLARRTYGENVKFEKREKPGAKFFVWTSGSDGQEIFAAVSGGVIYVGNDEKLIDKCLDVGRGKSENLLKNERLARARDDSNSENKIAFGYVSGEAVAQIANLAGVSVAVGATENDDGRSFIARVLPQILQKTTREILWTASRTEQGIEDEIFVGTNVKVADVLNEALQTSAQTPTGAAEFLPADVFSATRYDLKNPHIAWRVLLLTIGKQIDGAPEKFLARFSNNLLESYGIADADTFLSAVDAEMFTAKLDEAGEKSIAVVTVKDSDAVKKSIAAIDFKSRPEKLENSQVWQSETGEFAAAFVENKLILGEPESVLKCLQAKNSGRNFTKNQYFKKFTESRVVAVTFAKDGESAKKVVEVLGKAKDENREVNFISLTETRFTEKGVERRTVSAFGLIGSILEQLE